MPRKQTAASATVGRWRPGSRGCQRVSRLAASLRRLRAGCPDCDWAWFIRSLRALYCTRWSNTRVQSAALDLGAVACLLVPSTGYRFRRRAPVSARLARSEYGFASAQTISSPRECAGLPPRRARFRRYVSPCTQVRAQTPMCCGLDALQNLHFVVVDIER